MNEKKIKRGMKSEKEQISLAIIVREKKYYGEHFAIGQRPILKHNWRQIRN